MLYFYGMKQLRLLLGIIFISLAGCVNAQTVDVKTFEQGLSEDVQLLDVRTADEYSEGHLKGATLADINEDSQFDEATSTLNLEKPVYVYCLSGRRSAKAAKILEERGFRQVVNLDGGIEAWKEAGKPIE